MDTLCMLYKSLYIFRNKILLDQNKVKKKKKKIVNLQKPLKKKNYI